MSKAIARLLSQPEAAVAGALKKIEDANGNPSADVRLLASQIPTLRAKITDLGLDPDDTTGEELYQALRARFSADAQHIDQALGLSEQTPLINRLNAAVQMVVVNGRLPQRWLVKQPVAKKLMHELPPKKLMKLLNYRSVQSLTKHQDVGATFLAAKLTEGKVWQQKMAKAVERLDSSAFELRPLSTVTFNQKIAQKISSRKKFVSDAYCGLTAAWPTNFSPDTTALAAALALIEELEKASGSDLTDTVGNLNPTLRWWADCSQLLSAHGDETVSLNICDIANDHLKSKGYGERSHKRASQSLLKQLAQSYEYAPDKVEEVLKDIGYSLSKGIKTPSGANLALEYAEGE